MALIENKILKPGDAQQFISYIQDYFVNNKVNNIQVFLLLKMATVFFLAHLCKKEDPEGLVNSFADDMAGLVKEATAIPEPTIQ